MLYFFLKLARVEPRVMPGKQYEIRVIFSLFVQNNRPIKILDALILLLLYLQTP